MAKSRKDVIACLISLYTGFCLVCYVYSTVSFSPPDDSNDLEVNEINYSSPIIIRKLLNINIFNSQANISDALPENCSKPDIEQFPRPLINNAIRKKGGILVHIFVSLYMFLGLAIICDEYFVPSLEKICKLLNIQSDVAGATFMAAGSSAPELATAIIAVFVVKDDIGIGTVVGSAVFNIAFVIGACGLFARHAIHLNWWPMFRDCAFYLISILALLFALQDGRVTWVESALFLTFYVLYIIFMFFNESIEKKFKNLSCFSYWRCRKTDTTNGILYHSLSDRAFSDNPEKQSSTYLDSTSLDFSSPSEVEEEEEKSSLLTLPKGVLKRILWIFSLPILFFCYITVPDCRKKKWEKWFSVTFSLSCVWIGFFSYILVWMITIIGYTLNIKDTIMGLSFLAAGASIPDAITSVIVVREGLGDMAVSNAIGSNVFDILLCLGLPWFIQTALVEPGSVIPIKSKGLLYSTLTLLLTIIFLLLATHLNHWKLDKKYGIILFIWYGIFMVVAILYESSLFGSTDLSMCPSDF